MQCGKCGKKMKLVSTWTEDGVTFSEYKCSCGYTETVESYK